MFAPKPFDVAQEMVRVAKPSGRIVMGNWIPNDPTSFVSKFLQTSASFPPPPAGRIRQPDGLGRRSEDRGAVWSRGSGTGKDHNGSTGRQGTPMKRPPPAERSTISTTNYWNWRRLKTRRPTGAVRFRRRSFALRSRCKPVPGRCADPPNVLFWGDDVFPPIVCTRDLLNRSAGPESAGHRG